MPEKAKGRKEEEEDSRSEANSWCEHKIQPEVHPLYEPNLRHDERQLTWIPLYTAQLDVTACWLVETVSRQLDDV